jgi:endonuclease/exonuclease/phosphatase family metal-dependent hydrolase
MRRSLLSLVVACLCLSTTGWSASAAAIADPGALTVLSLNLAMREDVDQIAAELTSIGIGQTDLLLLQEVVRRGDGPDIAEQLAARLGLASSYCTAFTLSGEKAVGLALVSRFPFHDPQVIELKPISLRFRSRTRIALAATVDTPAGPVRVYNVHLDTRINLGQRLDQLSAVAREVEANGGPTLVGGDFNTNNNFWLFNALPLPFLGRQGAGVQRFMAENGFTSVFALGRPTHDVMRMQLDWLFLRGLRASNMSIKPVALSDHHALLASLAPGD